MAQDDKPNMDLAERLAATSPMGRIAEPEEVAEAEVSLCTSRASFVLGHILVADGGAVLA